MSSQEASKPEFYFDMGEGRLVVGQIAIEACIEAGADPLDLVPLDALLTAKARLVSAKDFPTMPYDEWEATMDIPFAQWLHNLTMVSENQRPISEEIVTRTGYLGLSPRLNYFKSRERGFSGLYADAKIEGVRTRDLFKTWTKDDFVKYVNKLARKKGDKPTYEDLLAAATKVGNPHPAIISRRFGNVLTLFELAGYPDIKSWSREDFIDWGVRFMEANDGRVPTAPSMAQLSKKHRGPHYSTIYDSDEFSSLLDYQTEVMKAFEAKIQSEILLRDKLLEELRDAIDDPSLTNLLMDAQSEDEALAIFARYKVASLAVDDRRSRELTFCRNSNPNRFVSNLLRINSGLSAAKIEILASRQGVFDFIWPMDNYKQELCVAA